jgi:hypothetical protein
LHTPTGRLEPSRLFSMANSPSLQFGFQLRVKTDVSGGWKAAGRKAARAKETRALRHRPAIINRCLFIQPTRTLRHLPTPSRELHPRMSRTAFVALLVAALAVGGARCHPPGSNPGLPPSATATGLAAQKITDMTGGCMRLGWDWWD